MFKFECPTKKVDVVLDTDAYNEIDDQYAIAYMLQNPERLNVKCICAAPFFGNGKSLNPADGMKKSFEEIKKVVSLANRPDLLNKVYPGSEHYLTNETTPVNSPAAQYMADLANSYSPENPLYIIAIGAITNVASALLLNPSLQKNAVVIWLGGNSVHYPHNNEFNLRQDIAAARIVFGCGVALVQLPCGGVVDHFSTSRYELEHWLLGKNRLCNYLVENTVREAESYAAGKPWTRVIWDVAAIAWLLNDGDRFMGSVLMPSPIPEADHHYSFDPRRHLICSVTHINRDALFEDLFKKLSNNNLI